MIKAEDITGIYIEQGSAIASGELEIRLLDGKKIPCWWICNPASKWFGRPNERIFGPINSGDQGLEFDKSCVRRIMDSIPNIYGET